MASVGDGDWMPAGLSAGLRPRDVRRARIRGDDLAIWRRGDGAVRAFENRCPHRGMRLSFGFVRDNCLTCLYHGWTYDGGGACVAIPAHPGLAPPRGLKVRKYACAERNGMIWVGAETIVRDPPELAGAWSPCRTIAVDVPAGRVMAMLANLGFVRPDETTGALLACEFDDGSAVACAIQADMPEASLVHILFTTPVSHAEIPVHQRHYDRWSRRLRFALERGECAPPVGSPLLAAA